MSTKAITPQNLAVSATEFAPLFATQKKETWDTLCELIVSQMKTEYPNGDIYRCFVLDSNTGINDGFSIFFPVVAKSKDIRIKESEAVNSRPELAMAQIQDQEDLDNRSPRASGSYRISSSTEEPSVYGTCGVVGIFGTTEYILKLAIRPSN